MLVLTGCNSYSLKLFLCRVPDAEIPLLPFLWAGEAGGTVRGHGFHSVSPPFVP